MNRGVLVAALAAVGVGGFFWFRSRQNVDSDPVSSELTALAEQAAELVPADDTGDAVPPSPDELQESIFGDPSLLDSPPPLAPGARGYQTSRGVQVGGGDVAVQRTTPVRLCGHRRADGSAIPGGDTSPECMARAAQVRAEARARRNAARSA